MDFRFDYCYSKFCLSPSLLICVALQKPSIYRIQELPATWPLWEKCSELFPQCTSVNVTGDRLVVKCESFCHRFFISNKKSGLECLEWDFKAVSSSWFISCQKLSHFSEIGAIKWFIHLLQRLSAQSRDFYRPLISNQESVFCWCSQLVYG